MANPRDWLISSGRFSVSTDVKTYNDANVLYPEMCGAIRAATAPQHFVYLLGWHVQTLGSELTLIHGDSSTSLEALFKAVDAKGAMVRAMWDYDLQQGRNTENLRAVRLVNRLAHGAAVLDHRYLAAGSHHQKVLVVSGEEGIVAFVGGWDIHPHRWNWADVEVRLTGGAARYFVDLFHERWLDHPDVKSLPATGQVIPALTSAQTGKQGTASNKQVQVARTYPNAFNHGGLDPLRRLQIPGVVLPPAAYSFAPNGEFTVLQMILNAVSRAREMIYVEDQYLYASEMRNLPDIRAVLARRLAEVPDLKLIALINRTENIVGEVRQPWLRRLRFLDQVRRGVPGRVTILQYKNPDPYLHTKCWVIDDQFAVVGSANCNRRGYSHDSEVAVGIAGKSAGGNELALDLRIQLWLKHLNPPGGGPPKYLPADVRDWRNGLKLMLNPASRLELYNERAGTDPPHGYHLVTITNSASAAGQLEWDTLLDPDGS